MFLLLEFHLIVINLLCLCSDEALVTVTCFAELWIGAAADRPRALQMQCQQYNNHSYRVAYTDLNASVHKYSASCQLLAASIDDCMHVPVAAAYTPPVAASTGAGCTQWVDQLPPLNYPLIWCWKPVTPRERKHDDNDPFDVTFGIATEGGGPSLNPESGSDPLTIP
jgi:hypothetical protein